MLTHPPLVLLTRRLRLSTRNLCILTSRRLLSTGASPPFCIGFADWLSRRLSPCRLCFASPFLALPPHVSFLYPLPCVCIGWLLCRILTRRLCLPSPSPRPRGRFLMASASCHAGDFTSRSNLVRPQLVVVLPLAVPPSHIRQLSTGATGAAAASPSSSPSSLSPSSSPSPSPSLPLSLSCRRHRRRHRRLI